MTATRFPFAIDPRFAVPLRAVGVRSGRAEVVCDDAGLDVRFGVFRVRTPWDNVAGAEVSGPYRWWRAVGPRLSLSDRGATFGSAASAGVCVRFHRPVPGLFGPLAIHPGLTVTVADPDGLRVEVAARTGG